MQKKSDLDLKSTVWLTSSTLFFVGLIFGLVEINIIIVFYKYLPFSSLFEKVLFFLSCTLIYPAVFGLLGIPLGGISYFLSRRLKITEKISLEHFLVACYLCICFLILVGIRLEHIIADYQGSIPVRESIIGLGVLTVAVFISIIGFFLSKLLKNFTSKVPVSVCFIASILFVGIIYSFVKISEDIAKAEGISKSMEKVSSVEVSPPLDLRETNIILISVDTLRADHLSSYGYGRKTSPNIDGLAEKGILFTGAKTQKTSTAPSLASVLTGTYTNRHLVNRNGVTLQNFNITIPETLKKYGYKTAALLSTPVLGTKFGFDQGFDYFEEWSDIKKDELLESRQLNKMIVPWLRKNSGQRFFLWIHYRDPHTPYVVPPEYEKLYIDDEMYGKYRDIKLEIGDSPFGEIRHEAALNGSTDIDYYISQYDAEIKFNDDSIGKLFRVF
jgi:Arylsulfatase A and related enzymes